MADYPTRPLPRFFAARQELPHDRTEDVAATVRAELERIDLRRRLRGKASVAITAGSRGGATPAGQRHVLAEYGITERSVGAPIRATMDTLELGQLPNGGRVYFD